MIELNPEGVEKNLEDLIREPRTPFTDFVFAQALLLLLRSRSTPPAEPLVVEQPEASIELGQRLHDLLASVTSGTSVPSPETYARAHEAVRDWERWRAPAPQVEQPEATWNGGHEEPVEPCCCYPPYDHCANPGRGLCPSSEATERSAVLETDR